MGGEERGWEGTRVTVCEKLNKRKVTERKSHHCDIAQYSYPYSISREVRCSVDDKIQCEKILKIMDLTKQRLIY